MLTELQSEISQEELRKIQAHVLELKSQIENEAPHEIIEDYIKNLQRLVKIRAEYQDVSLAIPLLRELIRVNDKSEATSTAIGWLIFAVFKVIATDEYLRKQYAQSIPEFIASYLSLEAPSPSPLHSAMLYMANKLCADSCPWFLSFLKQTGLESLQDVDFTEYFKDGKKFNPLAEQLFIKAAKIVEKEKSKEYAEWLLSGIPIIRKKMPNELWLLYHQGKLLVSLERYTEAKTCLKEVLVKQKTQYWAWAAYASVIKYSNPETHLACLCKSLSFPVEEHLLVGIREELVMSLVEMQKLVEAKTEIETITRVRKHTGQLNSDLIEEYTAAPWYAEAGARENNLTMYIKFLPLADAVLIEDTICYTGIVTAYFEEDKGVFIQFGSEMVTLFKPQRNTKDANLPAIGTTVKVYVEESISSGQKRFSATHIEVSSDMPDEQFCKQFIGDLKVPSKTESGSFGFVDDIFISAELVKKACSKKRVSGLCVHEYNKKRNQFGWKALTLAPAVEEKAPEIPVSAASAV
ncbi:MAG: hypothetical protein HY965_05480 [Ignavibacteriales bacterium]|nr:hypothetical protein [Ignavibacteriales bacterium]